MRIALPLACMAMLPEASVTALVFRTNILSAESSRLI